MPRLSNTPTVRRISQSEPRERCLWKVCLQDPTVSGQQDDGGLKTRSGDRRVKFVNVRFTGSPFFITYDLKGGGFTGGLAFGGLTRRHRSPLCRQGRIWTWTHGSCNALTACATNPTW
ncbi:hypothetical protein H6P81_000679 [Aristolochia fimbriata]|uniref:Uncharacterized protein n=1 Tax=Aristolochia fimbriata TaxID=158543 RepID=A0AAV7F632_ARIFI|nr:hypothetical protein H6P81_000679 [Aristolochia fimbriata]